MAEKKRFLQVIDSEYYAEVKPWEFMIKGHMYREPDRSTGLIISSKHKQTARWLAKALLEWAGEDSEETGRHSFHKTESLSDTLRHWREHREN